MSREKAGNRLGVVVAVAVKQVRLPNAYIVIHVMTVQEEQVQISRRNHLEEKE